MTEKFNFIDYFNCMNNKLTIRTRNQCLFFNNSLPCVFVCACVCIIKI